MHSSAALGTREPAFKTVPSSISQPTSFWSAAFQRRFLFLGRCAKAPCPAAFPVAGAKKAALKRRTPKRSERIGQGKVSGPFHGYFTIKILS
jgi:hypothetical protein